MLKSTQIRDLFRDVIGGYIIKAAMENVLKIGGSYIERIFEVKYNLGISDDSCDAGNPEKQDI